MFRPRPKQQEVLDYASGKMGVSAVPGSGKTYTLSLLAAQIVTEAVLEDDQEVLVVTLVNSAVDNFAQRVAAFLRGRGLLPNLGYRVRTLHGLAHDIVRGRPDLVGLSDAFEIVDEREADLIRRGAADAWLRANPSVIDGFLAYGLEEGTADRVRRAHWPNLANDIASSFIRQAKDMQWSPVQLRRWLDELSSPPPLLEMGSAIYADYQRALTYRGAVDFDDLIRLALQTLDLDAHYLERLRRNWPFILEDEAQDSSQLQEKILRRLVGSGGNWVRVGDPNQAIYETFTTASPQFLRDFLQESGVDAKELPNSGRSTRSIIALANQLIDWTQLEHPVAKLRGALAPPHIEPAPAGDPQPNPLDAPEKIALLSFKYTPDQELLTVVESLVRWLPDHQDDTVAILVPRNQRGFEVINWLKGHDIDCVELLRSTESTRKTAGVLGNVVNYLADPSNPKKLATVYRVWRREDREDGEANKLLQRVTGSLKKCRRVETFLWPRPDVDWLDALQLGDEIPGLLEQMLAFRELVRRWQGAVLLPIDQLILTLAQDLFQEPADLAVAHKLAGLLRRESEAHPEWQLPELNEGLATIARNERRFLGLSGDDTGFDPERHKGKVVVATLHKAKGLEWDRVHLMSVNNYDFPSGQSHDQFIGEKWFLRDRLNLQAEVLAQLKALDPKEPTSFPREGEATWDERLEYAAERLRLLYVGITRARKELVITWNTGRKGDLQPAVPFIALQGFLEERKNDSAA